MEKADIKPRKNLFVIEEEGNYLAFDPEEGDEWRLNETGAFIVKNLIRGDSLKELRDKIIKEYGLGEEEAIKSLQEYIDVLKKRGILLSE